jgi:uncharacterized protein (DUF736 family)
VLNAVGFVIKQTDGRYKGHKRFAIIKAEIDILPTAKKHLTANPTSAS